MMENSESLPSPGEQTVLQWLGAIPVGYLHDAGWITVNRRFHGIAMAARHYAHEHLAHNPDAQAAFFDGLTLGLAALAREDDIAQLHFMFDQAGTQHTPDNNP